MSVYVSVCVVLIVVPVVVSVVISACGVSLNLCRKKSRLVGVFNMVYLTVKIWGKWKGPNQSGDPQSLFAFWMSLDHIYKKTILGCSISLPNLLKLRLNF